MSRFDRFFCSHFVCTWIATNDYAIGIIDDAIADGISQQRIGQFLWSARNIKPGTEDRGVSLVPGLHDFQ